MVAVFIYAGIEKGEEMQALVAFDVADDQRRYRVTKVLLDYGERVQESVFWVECEDDLEERIRERLGRVVSVEADNVWWVQVCQGCARKVETMGLGRKPEIAEYYVI